MDRFKKWVLPYSLTLLVTFGGVFCGVSFNDYLIKVREKEEAIMLASAAWEEAVNIHRVMVHGFKVGVWAEKAPDVKYRPMPVTVTSMMVRSISYQKNSHNIGMAMLLNDLAKNRYEEMNQSISDDLPNKYPAVLIYALTVEMLIKWNSIDCRFMQGKITIDVTNKELAQLQNDIIDANRNFLVGKKAYLNTTDKIIKDYPLGN